MPIPHWYKEKQERERVHAQDSTLVLGVGYTFLATVLILVIWSM